MSLRIRRSRQLPIALLSLPVVATLLVAAPAARAQVGLRLQEVPPKAVRVDGQLREWQGIEMARLGEGTDASMVYALGYDPKGLYVAATVYDDRLIRSAAPTAQEDAIIVTLVLPSGRRGVSAQEIYLWAGIPGRMASKVGLAKLGSAPRPLAAATMVEGPLRRGRGYQLEAFIPWSALGGGKQWQKGRGAIRLRDVDTEAKRTIEAEHASAKVDPQRLTDLPDLIPSGGEEGLLASFASANGLPSARARFDFRADVAGDKRAERVAIVDRFAVVLGEGYKDGQSYDFAALPVRSGAALISAEMRDLTADRKAELVVKLRQRSDRGSRDLLQVYDFSSGVRAIFSIELSKETSAGSLVSSLTIERPRKKAAPTIVVKAGKPQGLTPDNFQEAPAEDAEAILLPWGDVLERSYRWDGRAFAKVSEKANPRPHSPSNASRAVASRGASRRIRATSRPTQSAAPTAEEMLRAVRRAQGIPRSTRERFRRSINLAEGKEPELLVVLDRVLVVVGPGFRGGDGYFHYELSVENASDITALHTEDVTGDGRAEIFIVVKQRLGEVEREIVIAHQFTPRGFPRLMAAEIARRVEGSSIENELAFVGKGRGRSLVIRPGRARGWSASSYPFRDEPSADGVEAPLLPWSAREARYRYVNGRLLRK